MAQQRPMAAILRAEARLLAIAGMLLLAIGFPFTLFLAWLALNGDGVPPLLPVAAGAPPILLGYFACHFAARRMVKARELENPR